MVLVTVINGNNRRRHRLKLPWVIQYIFEGCRCRIYFYLVSRPILETIKIWKLWWSEASDNLLTFLLMEKGDGVLKLLSWYTHENYKGRNPKKGDKLAGGYKIRFSKIDYLFNWQKIRNDSILKRFHDFQVFLNAIDWFVLFCKLPPDKFSIFQTRLFSKIEWKYVEQ